MCFEQPDLLSGKASTNKSEPEKDRLKRGM